MNQVTDTNSNIGSQDDYDDQFASKLSEENSRKMILESYEKAGVDLPLVSLETVLDREISEDDNRQTGTPRFRKFLNKASSAMTNRALNAKNNKSEGSDDEIHVLSSASYTSNSTVEYETPPIEQEKFTEIPQTPQRTLNSSCSTEDTIDIIPPTPESMKNDCHPTFDFCCPKTSSNASPTRSCASDKYVMSNLQLAEGFDDEHHSVDIQQARDVPALMDVENSIQDDSFVTDKPGFISKRKDNGMMSYIRGSPRFQYAILVCCILHVVLVGLIIAFVANTDDGSYEIGSSSSAISQGQAATSSSSSNITTDLGKLMDPVIEESTDYSSNSGTITPPVNTAGGKNTFEDKITGENTAVVVVQEDQTAATADDVAPGPCVNSLEVSMNCVGEGSELLVYFDSCTPRPGDWVAIYEFSANPEFLLDSESIGWLYTCGDRFCEESIQKEVLSFTRLTDRAEIGTYRAHLIREGEGPMFSSIASSSDFRIVADADVSC